MRNALFITCLLSLISAADFTSLLYCQSQHTASPSDLPEARQFDFWIGEWRVNNRFIQEDGAWQNEGNARVKIYPVLNGKAIMEFWDGTIKGGAPLKGFSLRYYDAEKEKWQLALNWPSPNHPGFGFLEGQFRHGRGEFFNTYKDTAGHEVISRYTFSDITPTSLRWDDATSRDGGKTWKANWIMEFSRSAPQPAWPAPDEKFHTDTGDTQCTLDEARAFDFLTGEWHGAYAWQKEGKWQESPVAFKAWKVLAGCGVLQFMETAVDGKPYEELRLRSYWPPRQVWMVLCLDNQPGTVFEQQFGKLENGKIELKEFTRGEQKQNQRKTIWTKMKPDEISFEHVESYDGGENWQVNAKIQLSRKNGN